ncbi:PspA-associated protein PspAB [Allonocardiopsis opalescens]|uniref:Uncharacterized protein n=1 Tax=Allonocardiopsis opalescens TaxID=1144618 RepID=A0A2T0PZU6_9ACTN|nr:hypothetical protein [Allonocardiopsis opalescens]PRX97057.1 hypothetical protein CLV72_10693 [Allonocardiopsis opalescens]
MGFLDALFGRSKQVQPNLDRLFALPSAAVTLQASAGFTPAGTGSVCFRAVEGQAFSSVADEVTGLLESVGGDIDETRDDYGYTWVTSTQPPDRLDALVTDIHAVNSALEGAGFGPQLLCSLFGFTDSGGRRLALVYLYKRGTFFPFAPLGGQRRDNALELQVRASVAADLPIEPELERWLALWGAPGM